MVMDRFKVFYVNINIFDNKQKDINGIIKNIKTRLKYLKLKSANIENNSSSYVFWYEVDVSNLDGFLNDIKKNSDQHTNISIYSKSGAHE